MGTPRIRPAGAVWLALRAGLRLRWRAMLGLALVAGLAGLGGGRRDHALVCWQTAFTRVATGTSACLRDGRCERLMVRVSRWCARR